MLGGIDPIILFQFFTIGEAATAVLNKIPLLVDLNKTTNFITMPPIPIYLSERLTGIYIDAENKNLDLETDLEADKAGDDLKVTQRALNSSVTVEMIAHKDSIGLTILSAMMDVLLNKFASKEYSITYLHGAITVFQGKLNSFSINQNADNTLYRVTMNLSNSTQKTKAATGLPQINKGPAQTLSQKAAS